MMIKCLNILLVFVYLMTGSVLLAQNEIYEPSPEYIEKNKIKRIIELSYRAYHEEKDMAPDTTRIRTFNQNGYEIFGIGFMKNARIARTVTIRDDQNRVIRTERYDGNELTRKMEINYLDLSNGDYIERFTQSDDPRRIQFYKHEFDPQGNEICREYWNEDSAVINWNVKTYNDQDKLLSDVYQVRNEDTMGCTLYYYKNDTLLIKKEFYHKNEFSSRTKYEYYPDGREKVVHYGDQSSWYSFYNDNKKLEKVVIVRHDAKDTLINNYKYNEHGLISMIRNERKNRQERSEVFTYQNGKEHTKTVYIRKNQLNGFFETVYLGDTARVIYQTPYWKNKAAYAKYQRVDKFGNILEERNAQVRGMKQPLQRWMKDAESKRYRYDLNESGKVLAKYQRFTGWPAEECLCKDYTDDRIVAGIDRLNSRSRYISCDTIRTKRHNGGRHYIVSMSAAPDLKRHVYQNKNGVVDSILDINKSGAILNRMIKENGARVSYTLLNRYEYTEFDSLQHVYQCFTTRNYATFENRVEEHFWNGKQKVKELKYYGNWSGYSRDDTTLVTYTYHDDYVLKTIKDRLGKVTEHLLKYDENNRLIERSELNRQSGSNHQTRFTYDSEGNLLEKTTTFISTPIETLIQYEFY